MCAPFLIACLNPANSSQFIEGSVHKMPLLPHQCCSPAIRVVGFDGTFSFPAATAFAAGAAATEDPAWLATRVNGATTTTAERAALSESLIPNPFFGIDPDRPTVIRPPLGRCKTQPGAIPLLGSAPATARAGLSPADDRRDQMREARDIRTAQRAREPAGVPGHHPRHDRHRRRRRPWRPRRLPADRARQERTAAGSPPGLHTQ